MNDLRFTIVIPTHDRRDVLLESMKALSATRRPWPCELVVVDDGSSDGSHQAARSLSMSLPTTVVRQENRGAGAARNRGATVARGRWLLFLDDDMSAAEDLLIALDAALGAGADAVVGHIPVHGDVCRTLLVRGLERWVEKRHARLVRSGGRLGLSDMLTGQLAVRKDVFDASGGFDESFNEGGTFGAEDTDFLYRLLESGADVRYAPDAVSHQRYTVSPAQYLRQWRQGGRADAALVRKHPDVLAHIVAAHRGHSLSGRALRALARRQSGPAEHAVARRLLRRVEAGAVDWPTQWAFTRLRDAHYWRGAEEAGGLLDPVGPTVLTYHAVTDLHDEVIGRWCVTPERFEQHVRALDAAGVHWIGVDDLLAHLDGRPVLPRSVLLTFDDAYAGLWDTVVPVLRDAGIPALVLPVTGYVGGTNEWDVARGASALPLLSTDQLRSMARTGWDVGVHTRTHPHLVRVGRASLADELAGALEDLRATGLSVVPVVAYPYGEHDVRVRAAARRAGYVMGLGLDGAYVRRSRRRLAVPRLEVTRETTAEELVRWVRGPRGRSWQWIEREARWAVRTGLAAFGRGPGGRS
ncbi:glycosyltransferase [Geodermatophilus sp. SYSU D00814]